MIWDLDDLVYRDGWTDTLGSIMGGILVLATCSRFTIVSNYDVLVP